MAQLAGVGWNERVPVGGIDVADAEQDEEDDDRHFDRDDPGVEGRGLFDADIADRCNGSDDENGGHVDDGAGAHHGQMPCTLLERRTGERCRNVQAHLVEQADDISRPAHRDGADCEQVFENQIPADEPRNAFTEGCVGVRIGAARNGNHGGKLGITEAGERAADAREDEGEGEGGTCMIGRGRSGQHENAGADDSADTQSRQGRRRQHTLQLDPGSVIGLKIGDRLGREKLARHKTPGTNYWRGLYVFNQPSRNSSGTSGANTSSSAS